jgi:hypothetical protein
LIPMEVFMSLIFLCLIAWIFAGFAVAEERAFTPGRPGANESPITVPAGRLQVETELYGYGRDKADGVRTTSESALFTSLRYGVSERVEAELLLAPFLRVRAKSPAGRETLEGPGAVTLRVRINLMGNDGGDFAAAVIPFVTFASGEEGLGEDETQGGAFFALSYAAGPRLGLSATLGAATADDGAGGRTQVLSWALGAATPLGARMSVFAEVAGEAPGEGESASLANLGATWLVLTDTQLDVQLSAGLDDAAEDARIAFGWARRF